MKQAPRFSAGKAHNKRKNGAGAPVAYPAPFRLEDSLKALSEVEGLKRGASITASLSQSLGTSLLGRARVHSSQDVGHDKP